MFSDTSLIEEMPTKVSVSTKPVSRSAARFTLIAATGFLGLLLLLHFIKPEMDPSWHFISEYALGRYGWVMSFSFLLIAAGYISLFAALRLQFPRSIPGKIAQVLILISAAGLALAGVFATDPIDIPVEQITASGSLHKLGGTLGLAMPFAALFTTIGLLKNPEWSAAKRPLWLATIIALLGFLAAFVSMIVMLTISNGKFGPGVSVGWPNRIEMAGYVIWLMVVAGQALIYRK
ncbi:MAG TPA: DUF998 domain-containing protein [Chitinophagaceae bacterium]